MIFCEKFEGQDLKKTCTNLLSTQAIKNSNNEPVAWKRTNYCPDSRNWGKGMKEN